MLECPSFCPQYLSFLHIHAVAQWHMWKTCKFIAFTLTSPWSSILVSLTHMWPLSGGQSHMTRVLIHPLPDLLLLSSQTNYRLQSSLSKNMLCLFICSRLLCGFFQECFKVSSRRFCMLHIKHVPSYFILCYYYR